MTVCKFGSDILRSGTGLNLVVRLSLIIDFESAFFFPDIYPEISGYLFWVEEIFPEIF